LFVAGRLNFWKIRHLPDCLPLLIYRDILSDLTPSIYDDSGAAIDSIFAAFACSPRTILLYHETALLSSRVHEFFKGEEYGYRCGLDADR
jgi:hypothetical protein